MTIEICSEEAHCARIIYVDFGKEINDFEAKKLEVSFACGFLNPEDYEDAEIIPFRRRSALTQVEVY